MRKAVAARFVVGSLVLVAGATALVLTEPLAAVSACSSAGCGACAPPTSNFGISTLISAADLLDAGETVMAFVDPNDGSSRRFVVSQEGFIWVWDGSTGTVLGTAFINLTARVAFGGERGLLSMAVSPDYVNDGEFYVYYTGADAAPGNPGDIVIERYTRSANPNIANTTPTSILVIAHPGQSNHNGGTLAFGPDGYLYVSTGDGGGGCDSSPGGPNAQNIDELLGKILRLDVAGVDPGATAPECESNQGYLIPTGNPYRGVTLGCGEIWSVGLRNPFRMSFDRETGDIFYGDVGQSAWEEINFLRAGLAPPVNFGWKCREGCETSTCTNSANDLCPDALVAGITTCQYGFDAEPGAGTFLIHDPILCHSNTPWTSIMGGYIYRGQQVPDFADRYFYSDYACGQLWATSSFDRMNPAAATATCWEDTGGFAITGFGEDHLGEVYIMRGGDQRVDCIHDGNADGCFWAGFRGLFEDDFESQGTGHWDQVSPP